jgi:hypothetical protein
VTDLQLAYQQLRDAGSGHGHALADMARRYDLDADTIARCLHKADEEDRQRHKRKAA